MRTRAIFLVVGILFIGLVAVAQEAASSSSTAMVANSASVPRLVRFSGAATDSDGKPLTGTVGITFLLYKDQQGGAPLWMETQNVQPDSKGHYAVQLGATKPDGLPTDAFISGEARWLGIQISGQAEQARVLLLSVPYAMKASDADTLGGRPASAFVLATPATTIASLNVTSSASSGATSPATVPPAGSVTGSGTANFIPLWTSTSNIGNSVLFQFGTGSSAKVGINNTAPAATLDVSGAAEIRGPMTLPPTGTATANAGKNSQPQNLIASAFNTGAQKPVNQTFQWQAEPAGNNTASPSGTLNLLFGSGSSKPVETGLKISNAGILTFANGQSFPGTGTITNVTAGTGLTGGGNGGSVTLSLDTSKVPLLTAANAFVGNQTITGNLSDTGNIIATGSVNGQSANFTGSNATQIIAVNQSGSGVALTARTTSSLSPALAGVNNATTGATLGMLGTAASSSGAGVVGVANSSTGATRGVIGVSLSKGGVGVLGQAPSSTLSNTGSSLIGSVVESFGAWGDTTAAPGFGVSVVGTADDNWAVFAENNSAGIPSVLSQNLTGSAGGAAFWGALPNLLSGNAVIGDAGCGAPFMGFQLGQFGMSSCNNFTLVGDDLGNTYINAGDGGGNPASIFFRINNVPNAMVVNADGSVAINNLDVTTSLTKPAGSFKIDHPLDPANKYLYHSFVESPDMKNIYDGVAALDENGEAWVTLPDWFGALNRDFRYQLTTIGGFAPVYIAEEIENNRFEIAGGKLGIRVSWQVTGTRQDAFAKAYRIPVEVEKAPRDRGHYLHPELFGAHETERIGYTPPMSDVKPRHNPEQTQLLRGIAPGGRFTVPPPPKLPALPAQPPTSLR